MRHGSSNRRQRNRGNSGGGGRRGNQNRSRVYDSNGPDVRIRGTAHQVADKYAALAKDAEASDDIILAQSYLQYAEHYQRIINSWEDELRGEPAGNQNDQSDNNSSHSRKSGHDKDGNKSQGNKSVNKQPAGKASDEDDLGLPSSILGPDPKSKKERTDIRTPELSE